MGVRGRGGEWLSVERESERERLREERVSETER